MNWRAWMAWAEQHQGRTLVLVFLMLALSPAIFLPLAGVKLLRMSRSVHFPFARYTAWLLLGIASAVFCSIIANIDPPSQFDGVWLHTHYSGWFVFWMLAGQLLLWLPSARLSWYILDPTSWHTRSAINSAHIDGD